MKATANQTLNVTNIPRIKTIINAVSDNLITDFSKDEMVAYGVKLAVFNTDNLLSEILPGDTKTLNGISFFLADEAKTIELFEQCINNINE